MLATGRLVKESSRYHRGGWCTANSGVIIQNWDLDLFVLLLFFFLEK